MQFSKQFDASRFPRKLNLGCGWDHRDGYLNIDLNAFHNPDLTGDVCDLAMLPSDYYFEIVAQDVLEHLPRTSTARALCEWNRLLEASGKLHLRIPSLEGLTALFAKRTTFASHRELMQCLFGTQAYTGDFHFTAFTKVLLEGYLRQTGFMLDQLTVRDEWLFEAVAHKVVGIGHDLEAAKTALLKISGEQEFLSKAYEVLLHRRPDSDGESYFARGLASQALTRAQVLHLMEASEEFQTLHGGAEETMSSSPAAAT